MDAETVRDAFSKALGPEWDVSVTLPEYLRQWSITATNGQCTWTPQWSTLLLDMPGRLDEVAETLGRRART